MSDQTVQMRALVRAETMIGGLKPRQVFWCNEAQAQHFIQHQIAELIAPPAGPQEMKPAAPAEVKVEEPEAKKSLVEGSAGHSTDSAKSSESGQASASSALPAGTVSTTATSRIRSMLTLPKKK